MSASSLRCLVLGRDPSGESHSLLTLLEPSEGLVRCLIRTHRGKGTTLPDLFDEGEVTEKETELKDRREFVSDWLKELDKARKREKTFREKGA
jgi:hypothetical protein